MIPGPWVALVLALAAFRLTRLAGWDDFPLAVRVRGWITGEHTIRGRAEPLYQRPTLAHLLACPWCIGFWISCAVYVGWLLVPTEALYAAAPFALSAFVGLVAKNLDP